MKRILGFFVSFALLFLIKIGFGVTAPPNETAAPIMEQATESGADIVLVLDNSGSMKKNDPKFLARDVVMNFILEVGKKTRLGLVIVDQEARLASPLVPMTDPNTKSEFLDSLDGLNYKGLFSNIPAGLERAIYELKTNGMNDAAKMIVFMTDGIVDTGDKARDMELKKWLREDLAQESRKAGIRIYTIAFTNMADFSTIQALSIKTGGSYFRVFATRDIQKLFKKITGALRGSSQKAAIKPSPDIVPETIQQEATSRQVSQAAPVSKTILPEVSEFKVIPPAAEEIPPRLNYYLPVILAGIIALLGIVVLIMVFKIKPRGSGTAESVEEKTVFPVREMPSIPQAMLVDVKNVTAKKTLTLNKRTTSIGRGSGNDVAIPRDDVSGFHATIDYRDGNFYLEDQRSRNKTLLNGEQVEPFSPKRLKSGDEIMFTNHKFIFLIAYQTPSGETLVWGEN